MPTPVITHNQLGWAFQTSLVNNIKIPSDFMTTLYFQGREETLPTESVELSYKEGERIMAPFVEVNAEAIPIGGRSTTFANVSCPNIRIKRPMEAYNVFLRRQPGTGMFIGSGDIVAQARAAAIAEDAAHMVEQVVNRLEWMTCSLLTDTTSSSMSISYQIEDRANWTVTIPRSSDMTLVTGASGWDQTVNGSVGGGIQGNFHHVKRMFSKHGVGTPTVCVMGKNSADRFMGAAGVRELLDKRSVSAGTLELINQFNESGAIYLGTFAGVPCWEYSREYVNDAGSAAPFIPDDLAIFLASRRNDGKVYYGAIPDHDAFEQGLFQSKRFSKSWMEKDPSVMIQLLQTRPLPFVRNNNSVFVMTTT